jgi:hypothetical protein
LVLDSLHTVKLVDYQIVQKELFDPELKVCHLGIGLGTGGRPRPRPASDPLRKGKRLDE